MPPVRALTTLSSTAGLVALLAAAPAHAHLGGGEGVAPFVEGGVVVGAGTTWGLIDSAADGYGQTCEEAIGDVPRDFVRVVDDDGVVRVFAATGLGVLASVDDGCSWSVVDGTADRTVLALVQASDRLLAVTGDAARENHLLVSDDGGASFATRHSTSPGVLLTSIAVGVDGVVVVAGADTAAGAPILLLGDGAGLQPLSLPLFEGARLTRALAVDDDALWLSSLDGIGRGHLVRVPRVDGVAIADDARDVGAFDGLVRATGVAGGFRFAIAASGVLFRVEDAGDAIPVDGWTRTTEGPLTCLRRVDGDDRLWGCATQLDEVWFKATRDGVTWEPVLPFGDVIDRACPADTPAAAACAYRFAPPVDDVPPGEAPSPPPPATTGCASGAASPWWLLPALWRRRRRA